MMSVRISSPPLTVADLAARWQITEDAAARRVRRWKIPAFNVGTESEPQWRFRLTTIEAWEANAERDIEAPAPTAVEAPKGNMPAAWDGKDRLGTGGAKGKKGPRSRG